MRKNTDAIPVPRTREWRNALIAALPATIHCLGPFNASAEEQKKQQPSTGILHYKPNNKGAERKGDLYISDTEARLGGYKGKMRLERGPTIVVNRPWLNPSARQTLETLYKVLNWQEYAAANSYGPCGSLRALRWLTLEPTRMPESLQKKLNITGVTLRLYSIDDVRNYTGDGGFCADGSYVRRLTPP